MASSLRVLVSAYACEPERGSEPGVGWNWVRQIARFHQVWVITRRNNQQSIESALAKEPLANVQWVYFDLPRWARFWKKGQRGVHLYYYLWQAGAYFVGRRLHRQVSFDIAHHVTLGTYWMPSFLALLPLPFLWGPVGGGESAPRAFWFSYGLRGKAYEVLRDLARMLSQCDPLVRLTVRRSTLTMVNTQETRAKVLSIGARKVIIFMHMGTETHAAPLLPSPPGVNPFRLVSVGRLIHWKGFNLTLRAFSRFQEQFPRSECWIIGEGPERKRLVRLADELGVADKVKFWGAVPRSQVLEKITQCHVLLHPSLHDSAPSVCLEAMAVGRPVICLDLGGPALQVTDETGIKVPAISPLQAIADLADAMGQLAGDPDRRLRLGRCARLRVAEHFAWDKKGEHMNQIYHSIQSIRTTQARSE